MAFVKKQRLDDDAASRFTLRLDMKTHTNSVIECAYSHDGAFLATGGNDKKIFIFDAESGKLLHSIVTVAFVTGAAWSPTGPTLIVTCLNGSVIEIMLLEGVWSHRVVYEYPDILYGCAVSCHFTIAIACLNKSVIILDARSKYTLAQQIPDLAAAANRVAFSNNGLLLAVGCSDGVHYIYGRIQPTGPFNLLTERRFSNSSKPTRALSFSPSGKWLLVSPGNQKICLCEVPTQWSLPEQWKTAPIRTFNAPFAWLGGALFTGDERHLIVAEVNAKVQSFAFHPETGRLVAGLADGHVRTFNTTPHVVAPPPLPLLPAAAPRAPPVSSFLDAHRRASRARDNLEEAERQLALVPDKVKATMIDYRKELKLLESPLHVAGVQHYRSLEESKDNANGELFITRRIIDHVTEVYSDGGYFTSLQPGVFFDQWLFDSGLHNICGKLEIMSGERLSQMTIDDLIDYGFSYNDAAQVHFRACMAINSQQQETPGGIFRLDEQLVAAWLRSQGGAYEPIAALGLGGPALVALTKERIDRLTSNPVPVEMVVGLDRIIKMIIARDRDAPYWLKRWNGQLPVEKYRNMEIEAVDLC